MKAERSDPTKRRRGVILVLVLVVIALLSVSVLAFSRYMMAERRGTNQSLRQKQARLLAESGVEYLRILLMKEPDVILELGGLYDNLDELCGQIVTDGSIAMTGTRAGEETGQRTEADRRDIGRFSVIAPYLSEDDILVGEEIRYGLEDESCKVNLRWVMQTEIQEPGMGRSMLLRLPGVTEEIADSILDWMDEDDETREYGAEDEYYSALDPPYRPRNGVPDSLDELLLVRGITPKLLYGIDWNRNGVVDMGEPDESTLDEFEVTDGSLNLGLITYLTLDSRESNITPEGEEKINVNMDDLEELRELLEERFEDQTWVDYIIAYREQSSQSSDGTTGGTGGTGDLSALVGGSQGSSSGTKINSLLDLVGTPSTAASSNSGSTPGQAVSDARSTLPESPFSDDPNEMNEYLPLLYDQLTISDTPVVGRINFNQASRTVLELFLAQDDDLTDSFMTASTELDATNQAAASLGQGTETSFSEIRSEEIMEGILAERVVDPALIESSEMRYPFWPYTHGIVEDLETMKKLEPYFCTGGAVFKATVVGRFDEQSPVVRLEVWLDATAIGRPARVIRIRELTDLGPGYAAELLGADEYSETNQSSR